jgi:acyl-CoA synthetase (AMP-forming)/AMP-acid ligase II
MTGLQSGDVSDYEVQTVGALLRGTAAAYPRKFALIEGEQRIDYRTLDQRTDRLAVALACRGVAAGDRVATILTNGIATFELYFALGKLGAIVVPLNWRWALPELRRGLDFSSARLVFVSERFSSLAEELAEGAPVCLVPEGDFIGNGEWAKLWAEVNAGPALPTIRGSDPWIMLFTSGTTGKPKGCVHRHSAYSIVAASNAAHLGLTADDTLLLTMPLFHVAGLGISLGHLAVGGGIAIAPRDATPQELVTLIRDERCTVAMLAGLAAEVIAPDQPLMLRLLVGGGGMLTPEQLERDVERLGCRIIVSYGQTEAATQSLYMESHEQAVGPTAIGRPAMHLEAIVMDDAGVPVEDGVVGELCLRGGTIMAEYWNDPAATAQALRAGWLRTGDSFWRDSEGYLHFAGRTKELIKTGGENVYPLEVEQVLLAHPAIRDCAVVGVADERWGEAVKAFVVADVAMSAADVAAWCVGKIGSYKRPRFVEFVTVIPRNFSNKVDRLSLAARPVTSGQRAT